MPLTDTAIKKAKFDPAKKKTTISDEKGMYLQVMENGSKYFRLDYRFAGKRKTLALGVYPQTTLKEAREKRDQAKKQISEGIDPVQYKKFLKKTSLEETENSFEAVAAEWYSKYKPKWSTDHASKKWRRLELYVLPYIGKMPIKQITSKDLLEVLRNIEKRGITETAHRTKSVCSEVFRYAIATDRTENDPSVALKGALSPKSPKNMATITRPTDVGELLRAISGYQGSYTVHCALKLTPYVFLRPGELRQGEWSEIDLENAVWKIPAEKMKMNRPHIIPLSRQAIEILKGLYPVTSQWRYIFPSQRSKERPMSNATITAALRRLDYSKEEMSAHGFRAMASTLLHENGWRSDIIEMQLAHAERNKVKAAYNYAQHLDERARMMQWWADYLDKLKGV
ncbi:tyrosine-type recombinase/integrase [Limisalsivibrio acetivorans]|uniref:tyrosine-type recombinase/integrase n=1 Tax=Limisalsivibrio acetivorans TaxID=1304888 RepID=UPI0003FF8C5F|nr:integrase arm-type DNA-binding domain-containing protein [Limisalsivibrio acetivorans]